MAARARKTRRNGKAIRYAVVGLGHIAQAAVLPAFGHARQNSRLAALVSDDTKKLETLGKRYDVPNLATYDAYDELLRSGEVDAVYIAVPNSLHEDYAVGAARAGVHVLCEKPLAMTSAECERIIRAAKQNKIKLMTAYRLHFERTNLEAQDLARSGKLGELRFFNSTFSMQVKPGNIRLDRELTGGPLYDIGIYCINAARAAFAAEPTEVWATATKSGDKRFREVPETVHGVMRFGDERIAAFTCSFGASDTGAYEIVGTKGSIRVDPAYEYAEGLAYEAQIGGRTRKRQFAKSDQFAPELAYFSECILRNREPEPSGEEGLADVRVIQAMHLSMRTGRWVSIDMPRRKMRPSLKQEIRRPAVPREPPLVGVSAPHS